MSVNLGPDYYNLHPRAGADGTHIANGRTFTTYWSWVTDIDPQAKGAKFPKGHMAEKLPIPKRWVRCAMPWASDPYKPKAEVPQTFWCPIMSNRPGYTESEQHQKGTGETEDFTPEIGTPVLLTFVGNDYRLPIVLGFYPNPVHDNLTQRPDLTLRRSKAGHWFITDDEREKKLRKLYWESSVGHHLAMYDQDQDSDDEEVMQQHNGEERKVRLQDVLGQKLVLYCPEGGNETYARLVNVPHGNGHKHELMLHGGPDEYASLNDYTGQFIKIDTNSQWVHVKANRHVYIESGGSIRTRSRTNTDIHADAGNITLHVPFGRRISLGPGSRKMVLDRDPITGIIFDSWGFPCSFLLNVTGTSMKVVGI